MNPQWPPGEKDIPGGVFSINQERAAGREGGGEGGAEGTGDKGFRDLPLSTGEDVLRNLEHGLNINHF